MPEWRILPGTEAAGTQRRWLAFLIRQGAGALAEPITVMDRGYDAPTGAAELIYERGGRRYRVCIQELELGETL